MEPAGGGSEDFVGLLRRTGHLASPVIPASPRVDLTQTQATTILAFKFQGGVLVAGDPRATAGNTGVFDRAAKILAIDRPSIMAIARVPATAWGMERVLAHSLQVFPRT